MKKMWIAMGLAAMGCTVCLTACEKVAAGEGGNKFEQLTTTESVYGFSAASAGMLISSMRGGEAAKLVADAKGEAVSPLAYAETAIDTGTLDKYMALVESLLSDGGFSVTSERSDREEYDEKMTVTYRDMRGNSLEYVMYYDQELVRYEEDRDETEETYRIEGVMSVDGAEYPVRGERSVETEGGESENETEFVVTVSESSYIRVEQSRESERGETEQEYEYCLYENGRLTERSVFEYEEERGETELKMISYRNGESEILYFERETVRGEELILLTVGSGYDVGQYLVHLGTDAEGNPVYEYEPVDGAHADDDWREDVQENLKRERGRV